MDSFRAPEAWRCGCGVADGFLSFSVHGKEPGRLYIYIYIFMASLDLDFLWEVLEMHVTVAKFLLQYR